MQSTGLRSVILAEAILIMIEGKRPDVSPDGK